jgi:phosphoglycolate phosphatase
MKTLLLWDIDGTLLASGGAGMRALRVALGRVFGRDRSLEDLDWAGRTDRFIIAQVFDRTGIPHTAENVNRYIDAYAEALPAELARSASVLPGVLELLTAADARPDVVQGLLTGNLRRGAEIKLGHHGLWDFFAFGAFADDSPNRNELGPHALQRAADHAGKLFQANQVWIIGDTPHDIECGRVIGANTLALPTGHHSADELAAHHPTAMLRDLSDAAAFWRLIEQPPSG